MRLHLVLHRVVVPSVSSFAAAHGTTADRDVVLVSTAMADRPDVVGWGECPSLSTGGYVGADTDGAWAWLVGGGAAAVATSAEGRGAPVPQAQAMAAGAVRDALRDLGARRSGRSVLDPVVAERLGPDPSLPHGVVVGLAPSIDGLLAEVGAAVALGAALVKLKVVPGGAAAAVGAVRTAWPDLALAVDANGSFSSDDPGERAELAGLADAGLWYVEQPWTPDDWHAHHRRWPATAPPVALDESVVEAADVTWVAAGGRGRIVNVKPARLGGAAAALAAAAELVEAGIDVFVGGMLETGVGRATALGVAATVATVMTGDRLGPRAGNLAGTDPWVARAAPLPTDLGPSARYLIDDLAGPVLAAGPGRVLVPVGPGIGVAPDPGRLAEVTVDRTEVDVEIEDDIEDDIQDEAAGGHRRGFGPGARGKRS